MSVFKRCIHSSISMHYSSSIKPWLLAVAIPAFLLSTLPGVLCSLSLRKSSVRVARETDPATQVGNQTQAGNSTDDSGGGANGPLPFTIYPPQTTIKEAEGLGFTAETGSTGSPFLQVKASPPTTGAMTGSASTKPMIIIGAIMLVGCLGGAVYLWYLRGVKMNAEGGGGGGGGGGGYDGDGGEAIAMQGGDEPDDPDDEEDAVPE